MEGAHRLLLPLLSRVLPWHRQTTDRHHVGACAQSRLCEFVYMLCPLKLLIHIQVVGLVCDVKQTKTEA